MKKISLLLFCLFGWACFSWAYPPTPPPNASSGAPTTADYWVGTTNGSLSAEIVVDDATSLSTAIGDETSGTGDVLRAIGPTITGTPVYSNGATSSGISKYLEDTDNGANGVTVRGPEDALNADHDIYFPADAGTLLLADGTQSIVTTGSISGNTKVATSTGGALAINTVTIATAAADYDLPDNCDSATGAWAMLYVRDAAETASLTVTDTSDTITYKGLSLGANDELDSPGAAQDSVVVVCMETNLWYVTANSGDWTDGGVP